MSDDDTLDYDRDASPDVPSNHELTERMVRVEQKQDHIIETTDGMAETIEEIGDQHDTLWLAFQATKWFIVLIFGSSLLSMLLQVYAF